MSEHSKGPGLEYVMNETVIRDAHGNMRACVLMAGEWTPQAAEDLHALGRKMAAAPELVEALEAIGMLPDGFCVCPSGRDPTRPEPEHVGECRDARAALKKAGVEP